MNDNSIEEPAHETNTNDEVNTYMYYNDGTKVFRRLMLVSYELCKL